MRALRAQPHIARYMPHITPYAEKARHLCCTTRLVVLRLVGALVGHSCTMYGKVGAVVCIPISEQKRTVHTYIDLCMTFLGMRYT